MSILPHHTSDPTCALCELKLLQAHSDLVTWYRSVKIKYPTLHISWSYRDQISQEQAFSSGASKLHYPNSAHNKVNDYGAPCARALDIFQIDESGKAVFDPVFCARLNKENQENGSVLIWGGQWRSLGDNDHFELPKETV